MTALETYLPLVQVGAFIFAWSAAMLTGLLFLRAGL